MTRQFTAIISRDGNQYVAHCPDLDIASQGGTVAEARTNLTEAIELFLETASAVEVCERLNSELYVTQVEVRVG